MICEARNRSSSELLGPRITGAKVLLLSRFLVQTFHLRTEGVTISHRGSAHKTGPITGPGFRASSVAGSLGHMTVENRDQLIHGPGPETSEEKPAAEESVTQEPSSLWCS